MPDFAAGEKILANKVTQDFGQRYVNTLLKPAEIVRADVVFNLAAEEIHEAGLTHAVAYNADGQPESIDSVALIAALWHRVNDLEERLKALEAE